MFKKKNTYLKICILMITILLAISAYTLAANISNVTGLKANISGSSAYLAWNSVYDASGYDVYFNISGTGYKKLGSVVGNGAKVSGFVSGSTYQSKVIAYKYVNGSKVYSYDYSNEITIMIPTLENDKPSDAKNLRVTINNKQARLTWDRADNASGYDIYFNIPGSGYTNIGSVDTNSANVSGFTPGYTYYAKILAYKNSNGKKVYSNNYSNEVSVRIENVDYSKPSNVTNLTANVNNNYVALDWNKSSNATGYEIYLYTPGYGYKKLTTVSNNYYDIPKNSLNANTTYYVKVLAYRVVNGNTIYANNYSNEANFRIEYFDYSKPGNVTNLTANTNNYYVALDWNKASNATGYEIYLYTPGYGYKKLTTVSNNYYDIPKSSLSANTTYYVKVLAYRIVNGSTIYANNYSNEANFRIEYFDYSKPSAAYNLKTYKVNNNKVELTWNGPSNATGYELYVYTPGRGYSKIGDYTTTYTYLQGFTPGYTYYAKVLSYRTVNGSRIYANNYSNEVSITMPNYNSNNNYNNGNSSNNNSSGNYNPNIGTVTGLKVNVTGTTAKFTWNKVNGVDGYELRMKIPGIRRIFKIYHNY